MARSHASVNGVVEADLDDLRGGRPVLFERRNNSTRQVPVDEVERFLAERFGVTGAEAK